MGIPQTVPAYTSGAPVDGLIATARLRLEPPIDVPAASSSIRNAGVRLQWGAALQLNHAPTRNFTPHRNNRLQP